MPAAAVVLPIAESLGLGALGATAASVGTAALSVAGIEASTVVASTVGGALIGAGEGAINAAIQGGDIAKGALTGGVGGAVSTAVGQEVGQALGGGQPSPTASPDYPGTAVGAPTVPTVGGMPELGSTAVGAASQGAGTTAAALASGQPLSSALQAGLRGAELGGIGGLVTGLAKYDFGVDPSTAGEIGTVAKSLAGYALPPVSGDTSQPISSVPPSSSTGTQASGTGQTLASLPTLTGPSPTLAQSLSIAPTLGYTPTGTVFGSSDTESPKQNVWNVGSLRNIGSAES